MNLMLWVLVALLASLVAGSVMKPGGFGRGWDLTLGLLGSIGLSGIFQSQWVSPDPGLVAVIVVAAIGAGGLIVAQRKIWPAIV